MLLPLLEEKLSRGDYSLRNVEAAVVEIDSRELANVNTQADLATLLAVSSLALRDRT
jgi:molybdopterin-guanine dinucleotide biosynthesis protein A